MVVENTSEIIATCHLTIMPSMTFTGSTRMQIEAVRVAEKYRGQKIGEWVMNAAIEYAKSQNATLLQLTTNKGRPRAKHFYEKFGFEATHEGMKAYSCTWHCRFYEINALEHHFSRETTCGKDGFV